MTKIKCRVKWTDRKTREMLENTQVEVNRPDNPKDLRKYQKNEYKNSKNIIKTTHLLKY